MKTEIQANQHPRKRFMRNESGLTMIELIVVIVIIGILTAVTIVRVGSRSDRVVMAIAQMIVTDIAFAQELAQIRNVGIVVTFDPGRWITSIPEDVEFAEAESPPDFYDSIFIPAISDKTLIIEKATETLMTPFSLITAAFVDNAYAGKGKSHKHEKGDKQDHSHGPGVKRDHRHCKKCGLNIDIGDDDDDDNGKGKGKGHGHGDDDDDDDGKGKGHGDDDDDDDDDGHGKGHGKGKGKGHGDDDDDHGHGDDDDDDVIGDGGFYMTYEDGTPVESSQYGNSEFSSLANQDVIVTSPQRLILFDSAGKLHVPNYNWGNNETAIIVCTLNYTVNIWIARYSGKTWIES